MQPREPPQSQHPAPDGAAYVERALGLVLLLLLAVACFLVLKPFLTAISTAVILSVSTWPVFQRLERALGGRSGAAALIMTLGVAALVVLPLVALVANLADDVARLSASVRTVVDQGLPPPDWLGRIPLVGRNAERAWLDTSAQGKGLAPIVAPYLGPLREWALRQGATLLSGTLQLALGIVLAFFLYRQGMQARSRLEAAMSRLGGWRGRHVVEAAAATIKSVVNGVLGTALIQGLLLGSSFWLAGVPGAVVLGAIAVVLSLLPLGLAALWLPAALWLTSEGHPAWALFIVAWNALVVGSLDNVLRPYLISRGTRMPMVMIFLGVLGGILTFGLVGVFLGPVLIAVAYTLILDWDRAEEPRLDEAGDQPQPPAHPER